MLETFYMVNSINWLMETVAIRKKHTYNNNDNYKEENQANVIVYT